MKNCAVFGFCVLALSTLANAQEKDGDGASYHSATYSNAASIEQFDFLMRVEVQSDIPGYGSVQLRTLTRMVCDLKSEKCFVVVEGEKLQIVDGEEKASRSTALKSLISNGSSVRIRNFPEPSRAPTANLLDTLNLLEVPDLRCTGLEKFPTYYSSKSYGQGFDTLFFNAGKNKSLPTRDNSRSMTFQQVQPIEGQSQIELITNRQYDLSTLMPMRFYRSYRQTSGTAGQMNPIFFEFYEWLEVNGIYLPVTIVHDSQEVFTPPGADRSSRDKLSKKYEQNSTASVHWFSVNEQLQEKWFSFDLLDDLTELRGVVDPQLTGAETLVSGTNSSDSE